MKKTISIILTGAIILGVFGVTSFASNEIDYTIVNPYETVDWDTWGVYKANLHTHSTNSDGDVPLQEMVETYYEQGYDILAMTDHGVIGNGWNKPVQTNGIFNYFRPVKPISEERYQEIITGSDRGGRGMLDVKGGIEVNMAVLTKTHVNGLFTTYGQGVWGKENDYRTAVAEIDKAGGFSFINHIGDWTKSNRDHEVSKSEVYIAYFAEIFRDYRSCLGMEIINMRDTVTNGDRILWDELLQVVIPTGRNIWAFTNDDSHRLDQIGCSFELFMLPENTEENLKTALQNGTFFAASRYDKSDQNNIIDDANGSVPVVKRINVDQETHTISIELDESRDCSLVEWIANGEVIATGTSIDLNDYQDKLGCYIRFRLVGEGGVTFSQPFELRYDGRVDKEIPSQALAQYRTPQGKLLVAFYQSLPYVIIVKLIEAIKKSFK